MVDRVEAYEANVVGDFSTTVDGIVKYANHISSSLEDIKEGTKGLQWWTSMALAACLGLYFMYSFSRVRSELSVNNHYQALFRQMWEEDRATQDNHEAWMRRSHEHQRDLLDETTQTIREIHATYLANRAARGKGHRGGLAPAQSSRYPSLTSSMPPGPERDEWIAKMERMADRLRQRHEEEGRPLPEELEEYDDEGDDRTEIGYRS
ncbi:hypothetical protein M426DRAFT_14577 [Hypoxylon sp. CI-4A]|nr:hypothetical protein M426DRAFT_14577 [Hypoxylon sp. CI-4A]